jgi:uncharacterized membrane protein
LPAGSWRRRRSLGAELDREGALNLDGAGLAYRRHDGRVELVQPLRLAPAGALSGAATGGLLGMLLLDPVLFAAVGAAGVGLSELGLNWWFLQQVNETLEPGRAALFFVVSGGADPDRAIDALQPLDPRVLRTTLDPAVEQRLLAAFTEPAPQPGSTSPSPSFGVTDHAFRPSTTPGMCDARQRLPPDRSGRRTVPPARPRTT